MRAGFVVLILAAVGLDGCGKTSDSGTGRRKFDSNGGRYAIELSTTPAAIVVNQPFDVTLTVTPKVGAVGDVEVQVDARMPAHFHGMNRTAKVSRGPGGSWKAEGLVFHMPGHWELYVDITQGGSTERAQMDVDLQ